MAQFKLALKPFTDLMMGIPVEGWRTQEQILSDIPQYLALEYMQLSPVTFRRDLDEMVGLELLIKDKKRYHPNISVLHNSLPQRK